jgi:hypothetical protein
MPTEVDKSAYGIDLRDDDENLPTIKPEDMQAFGALLNKVLCFSLSLIVLIFLVC